MKYTVQILQTQAVVQAYKTSDKKSSSHFSILDLTNLIDASIFSDINKLLKTHHISYMVHSNSK